MQNDWTDTVNTAGLLLIMIMLVGLVGFAVVDTFKQNEVERQCLAIGYPQGDFRWIGPNYCIKRVDQTDSVVVLP